MGGKELCPLADRKLESRDHTNLIPIELAHLRVVSSSSLLPQESTRYIVEFNAYKGAPSIDCTGSPIPLLSLVPPLDTRIVISINQPLTLLSHRFRHPFQRASQISRSLRFPMPRKDIYRRRTRPQVGSRT